MFASWVTTVMLWSVRWSRYFPGWALMRRVSPVGSGDSRVSRWKLSAFECMLELSDVAVC